MRGENLGFALPPLGLKSYLVVAQLFGAEGARATKNLADLPISLCNLWGPETHDQKAGDPKRVCGA